MYGSQGNREGNSLHGQSAMEYLMTYGWAILIVAVVLGALYSLGIFNGSNFLGGTCVAAPGYLCSNPLMDTSGTLSFTYGYQGPNVTIEGFACTNSSVAPSLFSASGSSDLQPGQEESVSVSCPLPSGATIGTQFSGYLWVEYDQAGQDNLITQVATIRTSASIAGDQAVVVTSTGLAVFDAGSQTLLNTFTESGIGGNGYIAVNPSGSDAYVPSSDSENIYAVDLSSGTIVANILIGSGIQGVAANPQGGYVYVASGSLNDVSVIDTSNNVVVGTVSPSGASNLVEIAITPNGQVGYVSDNNDNRVDVFYTSNYVVEGTVGVQSGPSGIAVSTDGSKVFVANRYSGTVSVISTSNNIVISTINVQSDPIGVASAGGWEFVTNRGSGTISVINTTTLTVTGTDTSGVSNLWMAGSTTDGNYALIPGTGGVTIIKASTQAVTGTMVISGAVGGGAAGIP